MSWREVLVRRRIPALLCALALAAVCPALAQDEPPPDPTPAGPEKGPDKPEKPADPAPEKGPEGAPLPEPDDSLLTKGVTWFPLDPGRRWHYQVEFSIEPVGAGNEGPGERTPHTLDVYVVDPQPLPGGQRAAVVEWRLDQDLAQRDFYQVTNEGVACLKRIQGFGEHMKEFQLTPPQVVAREQMTVGQEWTWEGKVNGVTSRQRFKVEAEETLETPAGTFQTLRLVLTFDGEDDSRGVTRRWLAPGVGIVKDESEVKTAAAVFRTSGTLSRLEVPRR